MHAAWISAALQRGGEPVRPFIVRQVAAGDGSLHEVGHRAMTHAPALRGAQIAVQKAYDPDPAIDINTCFRRYIGKRMGRVPFGMLAVPQSGGGRALRGGPHME